MVVGASIGAGKPHPICGADGATGSLLVALAVLCGAEVIATAGPASQHWVSALGARHVIDYHDQDWPDQVRAITARPGWPPRPTQHRAPPPPSALRSRPGDGGHADGAIVLMP